MRASLKPGPETAERPGEAELAKIREDALEAEVVADDEMMETFERPSETVLIEVAAKIGEENVEEQTQSSDIGGGEVKEKTEPDLTDIMAVLNKTELDLSSCSKENLLQMYERLSSHQKEVDKFKENITKILFGKLQ